MAEWITAIASGILAIGAPVAAYLAWKQLDSLRSSNDVQLFATLLKELSEGEAIYNRGLVWKNITSGMSVSEIKVIIEEGRKVSPIVAKSHLTGIPLKDGDIGDNALTAIALERTIAGFDRAAFFLLKNDNKLRMEPPKWLWTMVNDLYCRIHLWIDYGQTCVADTGYYHPGYATYLQRLFKIAPR